MNESLLSRFAIEFSHQVRTPLSVAFGALRDMRDGLPLSAGEVKDAVNAAEQVVQLLEHLNTLACIPSEQERSSLRSVLASVKGNLPDWDIELAIGESRLRYIFEPLLSESSSISSTATGLELSFPTPISAASLASLLVLRELGLRLEWQSETTVRLGK